MNFNIGDKVILIEKYDNLAVGSEGIIRGKSDRAQIEVTKNAGNSKDLHSCAGLIECGKGYNVEYYCLKKIEATKCHENRALCCLG